MLNHALRKPLSSLFGVRVSHVQARKFSSGALFKNKIIEKQRRIQGGATPYLRGADDPTFLRLGNRDKITSGILFACSLGAWGYIFSSHYRLWNDLKD